MGAERRCRALGRLVCLAVGTAASVAHGQSLRITPSLTVDETLTDNVRLSSHNPRSDLITDVAPGLRIDSTGARVRLNVDYRLHQQLYANDPVHSRTQNALDGSGTVEAVENWLFVDMRGHIAQQSVSAFGAQAPDNANVTDNRAETSTFRVSPYVRGRAGDVAEYQLRYDWTETRSKSGALTSAATEAWSASVKSAAPDALLVWSADATRQRLLYGSGRSSQADRLRGVIGYAVDLQLRLSLIGGHEANDYATPTKQGRATYGLGIDWSPDAATQVSATREKRIFGNGHSLALTHRTPLTAWKYTDRRDIEVLPSQFANVVLGTYYDLLDTMLTSRFPDPVQRDVAVRQVLQNYQISPGAQILGGFLTSQAFVDRRREGSVALLGATNVVTVSVSEDDRQVLARLASVLSGDFGSATDVRQRGYQATWSHQTSPRSSLSLSLSRTSSFGTGSNVSLVSAQRTIRLTFSSRIGPNTSLSLGARHVLFDSTSGSGYRESALIAALSISF